MRVRGSGDFRTSLMNVAVNGKGRAIQQTIAFCYVAVVASSQALMRLCIESSI